MFRLMNYIESYGRKVIFIVSSFFDHYTNRNSFLKFCCEQMNDWRQTEAFYPLALERTANDWQILFQAQGFHSLEANPLAFQFPPSESLFPLVESLL